MKKILWLAIPILLIGAYLAVGQLSVTRSNLVNEVATSTLIQQEEKPEEISISISPAKIVQGDPALITIDNLGTSTVKMLTVDGKKIPIFIHDDKPSAMIGIDLKGRIGAYSIVLILADGKIVKKELIVGERVIAKAPLSIPETLGGNTPESEKTLISTLVEEGAIISAIQSGSEKLWSNEFRFPIDPPITITDIYGYSRETGASTISHKGTDFRAVVGTPVYAMNSGKVVFIRYLRNYGNTIIIDHGLGLITIYMHLSEIDAKLGDTVEKGEIIAKSGNTGYVLGPHLHLTVRINGISIDPMKFMALFGPGV